LKICFANDSKKYEIRSFQVGHEMVSSTDDQILRQDMPPALIKVESAAKLLEEAAMMSSVS